MVDFLGEGTRSVLALGGGDGDPLLGDGTRSIFGESATPTREYDEIDAYQDVTEMMALAGGPPTAGEVEQQNADARYKEGQLRAYQQLYEESPPGNVALRAVDTAWFDLGATLKALYYDAIKGDPDAANKVMQSAAARRQALAEFDKESVLPETLARGVVAAPSSLATFGYGTLAGAAVGNPLGGAYALSTYRAGAAARADALADGATETEANIIGLANAAVELGVTAAFGAAGRGGLEQFAKSGLRWGGLRAAAKQVGSELAEENIIEQLSLAIDGVVRDKWASPEEMTQVAIDTSIQTLLAMGAMTGAAKVLDFIDNPSRKNAKEVGLGDLWKSTDRREYAEKVAAKAEEIQASMAESAPIFEDLPYETQQDLRETKVVDDVGRPKRVYHRTAADFAAFDVSKAESGDYVGVYFADEPSAPTVAPDMGAGTRTIPAYINLKNPATVADKQRVIEKLGPDWTPQQLTDALKAEGFDGVIDTDYRVTEYVAFDPQQVVNALTGEVMADQDAPPATPSATDAVTQAAATAAPYNAQDATVAAGIVPGAQIPAQPRVDAIGASWRSDSPAVEAAIEGSRFRPTVQSRWEQLKESAKELAGAFRSRRRFLDEKGNPADATTAEYLRLGEAARSSSKTAAVEAMAGYMKPLGGPEQYGLFSRVLLLRDLKRDIDSGKYGDTGLLPFSYDDASQVEADLAKAEAAAQATPAVAEALAARQAFIHSLRNMAVARKLLPEDVKDFDDYYHHQVIAYLKGSELVDGAAGATSLEDRRAGWQRGRKKLDPKKPISNDRLNYNTEFLDAEYAVVSSMLYKLRMAEVRDAIQGINDIKPRLQEEIEAEREERESRKGRLERQLKRLDPQNDAEAIAGLRKELDAIETESDMKRTWRDLVPEGYVVWQPDKGSVFFRGLTVAEDKLAELVESILASVDASFIKGHVTGERAFPSGLKQMLDTIDIPDIPGIRTALMVGGKKPEWVIPEHVAKELDAYGKSVDPGPVSQFSARVMQKWKRWQLNAPHRFLKYNLNNASGDTDILLAASPKVLTFLPQAYREVKKLKPGKSLTGDLAKAIEHGVIGSGFTSEIDTQGLSQSEVFDLLQGRLTNDVSARVRRILNRARPEHISEWRENVYRFAAYKHFLGEIKAGRRPWGVTPFQITEALYARGESPELIAARLSRDLLGDYGNRTVAGEYIRRHLIPFYSFQEINFQRYWNLFKNAVELGSREDLATTQGNQRPGDIASAAGKAIGKRAAYRTLQAGTMAMMYEAFITMYNKLVWPEEDRELAQNGRDQLHLILGRDREGNIITLRMQGAFSDVLGTFGLNVSDVLAVYEGDRPVTDVPKETLKAASGKLVNSSLPIAKTIGESLVGYTLFPDPYEPRPLRDPREHLAGMAMPSWFYRKFVSDVPQRVNSTADLVHTLITYSTDPAEASYFAARHLVSEFLKQDGREDVRWAPNAKSNAIYYHKQAIKYGDDELAEKWLQEYKRLGGTAEGYKQSIKSSHPLSGLNAAEKKAFANSLTPEEKEIVKRSIDWYNRIYNKPPTPAR